MTYEEIEHKYPEDYESRDEDKFNYRYRGPSADCTRQDVTQLRDCRW